MFSTRRRVPDQDVVFAGEADGRRGNSVSCILADTLARQFRQAHAGFQLRRRRLRAARPLIVSPLALVVALLPWLQVARWVSVGPRAEILIRPRKR